ncbi:MAG: TadE/TadG family type IV pilus assembly protein [Pseudomonadota bacterium]
MPARSFWQDTRGNIIVPFAVSVLAVITLVGATADYMSAVRARSNLQKVTDGAALATAREMSILGTDTNRLNAVAQAYLAQPGMPAGVKANAIVDNQAQTVTVSASAAFDAKFPGPFDSIDTLEASATARLIGNSGNVCVIALDPTGEGAIDLTSKAQMVGDNCSFFSNSSHPRGISVLKRGLLRAQSIFSSGGYRGMISNFDPFPMTDMPPMPDPLTERPAPSFGMCDHTDIEIKGGNTELEPGVYCGGISIKANATVELRPGVYVIKDGPFSVSASSEVIGLNVGLFLTGAGATFQVASSSEIRLSAPVTGEMAGLLLFEDRNNPAGAIHEMSSNKARYLVGTIYLPKGTFRVAANSNVADESEFTVIVANRIELSKEPNIVLNTDYDATPIPVPGGLGPVDNSSAVLIQ